MQNQLQLRLQPTALGSTGNPLSRTLFFASSLLTLFLIILYLSTPLGEFLDLKAMDFLLSSKTTQSKKSETVTITIDDDSLTQYGQWPWPRYRIAMLLEKIQKGGAKIIAVNILFPEQDRTSPIHWKKMLHNDLGYNIDTSAIPEILLNHDAYLAKTLAQGNYVLGYGFLFQQSEDRRQQCSPSPVPFDQESMTKSHHIFSLHKAEDVLCNNKILLQSGAPSGFFNGAPDKDGTLRRLPLLLDFEEKTYPSFVFEVLLRSKNLNEISIKTGPLGTRYLTPHHIPVDRKGSYLISNFSHSHGANISAREVLNNELDPKIFKDKIIFVGITASGLIQEYHLPNGEDISMLDIHRLVYESLTSSQHNIRGDFFWIIEALLTIVLTSLFALSIARLTTLLTCTILLPTLALLGLISMYLSEQWGVLFSPLLPGISIILTFFLLTTLKYRYFQKYSDSQAGDALQLLETSQANLQSILNTIPDIVYRLDTDGNIIFISSAVAKYKKPLTPLLGHSIFDLVVPEDMDKAQFKLNEKRTGSRATYDLEMRLRLNLGNSDQDDEVRYFSVSAAGLYRDNQTDSHDFIGTQGIVKDITQKKRMENQLLQAKKMEAMGNLAAGIAHDLNNILSGLVSYPDMILSDLSEDDPLYKKISLIKKSGQKAATIVQDLLTLARRNIPLHEVCDLNCIIQDYLESTEHNQAKQNHTFITIRTELAESPINIKGSSIHISKAVMNLINNAMEAIPATGNIIITTSKVEIKLELTGYENIPPGSYACMSIKDTGPGIPPNDIPRIFEPFYTKKPTRSKGTGTGLGMTIIWATIKDHSGYIDISSSEKQGTTITIYLPATDQQMSSASTQIPLDRYSGNETVLVVDDLQEQLTIAKNMLKKLGYNAITVQSGTEALDFLSKSQADLVMLDMIMPGQLDGLGTYEKILQLHPDQKAIISSGYSESDQVRKMQKLGAGSYIQKPYSMEDLARAVRTELDRKS